MNNFKYGIFFPLIFLKLSFFIINKSLLGETIKEGDYNSTNIIWEKVISENEKQEIKKIQWNDFYDFNEEIKENQFKILHGKDKEEILDKGSYFRYKSNFKKDSSIKFTEIEPFLPLNNFLNYGDWQSSIRYKSSFDGGASGGTGQQNPSFVLDYGLSDNTLMTIYITGADDELYNLIDNKKINYYWQSYALSLKKKLFDEDKYDFGLSMVSTIEYWRMASGSVDSKSIFNQQDNSLGKEKFELFIGSFSLPLSKQINKQLNLFFVPGITFMPESVGEKGIGKNSYGNNIFMGTGFTLNPFKNASLFATYTNLLGPGNNYFDDNLKYSRKPIYSFGFGLDINRKIGLEGKITNAYGSSPSTGLLTIPSDNLPLYSASFVYRPYEKDTFLNPLSKREKTYSHSGITVNNAFMPEAGSSQLRFNYDSKGNLFGFYGYSLSNIFQLELLNIGNFKELNSNNKSDLHSTYLSSDNINFRLGGKLLILSRRKDDLFDVAIRTSVGRNQDTNQGFLFTELVNTFSFKKWLNLNVNPKYFYSGVESFGGIGVSSILSFSDNLQLIPELNKPFKDGYSLNSTVALRYSYQPNRSIDFYYSNAAGIQDVGQLLKDNDDRFGINLNFLF